MNDEIQRKLAQQVELENLQKKVERMKMLVPIDGFHKAYFLLLKDSTSNVEAFNKLNSEYFDLFGVHRYSEYNAFRVVMDRKNKK